MYARHRGTFYVQLEDDILSRKGFINTMKTFALTTSMKNDDWFMLDFCQLGFIGKWNINY
jgi:alpha-1,3-mannosylglycoprotein beta-1,4-N-acetylglucosaminyltransferase A/B